MNNPKMKYSENEVRAMLADTTTRIKWLVNGNMYKAEYWSKDNYLLTLDGVHDSEPASTIHISELCAPDKFIFFKEVTRLERLTTKYVRAEPTIQEVVAAAKVGDIFETENYTELQLIEVNPNSNYARYVFKGTGKLFGDDPTVCGFSADMQTSNNRPIQNPSWKIVRKL